MKKIKIHPENRYLMYEDGEPFFWLGDTAWELFHRLNRDEADFYLSERARQGFNVIQAVALAEFDGLAVPNKYGRIPLKKENGSYNPEKPDTDGDYSYWDHVDYVIKKAEEYGLYVALLPTWGDKFNPMSWGKGPVVFNKDNAGVYGRWIAERYRSFSNIIWVLGGDRMLTSDLHRDVIDEMGKAIRECDPDHLITFHPAGLHSSAEYVSDRDYIDFHAVQSGHDTEGFKCRELLRLTYRLDKKPFFNMEPRYEDHPACFKTEYGFYWNAADVRQNAYWDVLEGVCGHTYGNHCIWSFTENPDAYYPYEWKEALVHEGALQMRYLRELRLSRPFFELRPAPELIWEDTAVNARQSAARGEKYAFAYSPYGLPVRVYLDRLCDTPVKVSWFNPRNGECEAFDILPPEECLVVPPSSGKGNDWVLIMDVM